MYIILLNYKKSLEEVDKYIPEHVDFLNEHYANKKFILSGRRNPRTGGIILATNCDRKELEMIISKDPFYLNEIAEYEIIDFTPTKFDEGLKKYIEP